MSEVDSWHLSDADVRKLKHAATLLNVLAGDPEKLDVLLELQQYLLVLQGRVVARLQEATSTLPEAALVQ